MRMRRKPRGKVRRGRRGTDWINVMPFSRCSENIRVSDCIGTPENDPTWFSLIDLQDVEDHNDNITLERLVGDLYFTVYGGLQGVESTHTRVSWQIMCGIYVSEVTDGAVSQWTALDPFAVTNNDRDSSWLWFKEWTVQLCAGKSDFATVFESTQFMPDARIDLRVKRKLKGTSELILAVQCLRDRQGTSGGILVEDVNLYGQLRALVKLT